MMKLMGGERAAGIPTREEITAKFFRSLGDRTRVRILMLIKEGDRSVGDLAWLLGLSEGRASAHLACLNNCGLVVSYRQGKKVYYRTGDEKVWRILELGWQMISSHAQGILSCTAVNGNSGGK